MIPVAEIRALQAEWQLRDDVVEKDYALGWLLTAIAEDSELKGRWVFKGGTALRKCYYETYRFCFTSSTTAARCEATMSA